MAPDYIAWQLNTGSRGKLEMARYTKEWSLRMKEQGKYSGWEERKKAERRKDVRIKNSNEEGRIWKKVKDEIRTKMKKKVN